MRAAGVARQRDGRDRPDLMPEALERKSGRALANMAIDDFGLDRQNVSGFCHGTNLAKSLGLGVGVGKVATGE
jgi:hypothetical protein